MEYFKDLAKFGDSKGRIWTKPKAFPASPFAKLQVRMPKACSFKSSSKKRSSDFSVTKARETKVFPLTMFLEADESFWLKLCILYLYLYR